LKIAANRPAGFLEFATERGRAQLTLRIILRVQDHDADPPHLRRLLRPRHHRPRSSPTEPSYELAPSHEAPVLEIAESAA
jgi:hypothetical protein